MFYAGKALLWVAGLLLIIIFIYAVISFALFQDNFDRTNNLYCQTLEECFVSVLRFGLVDHFLVRRLKIFMYGCKCMTYFRILILIIFKEQEFDWYLIFHSLLWSVLLDSILYLGS